MASAASESNAKTTNSKAQSSYEAKHVAKALEALRSELDDTADLFPINTCNDNQAVFTT